MSSAIIIKTFNSQLTEFLEDVMRIFPDNTDIAAGKRAITMLISANPKMVCSLWKEHIGKPYQKHIEAGNAQFFIDHDYTADVAQHENAAQIVSLIAKLKEPLYKMTDHEKGLAMEYIQNLTKLAYLI